MDKGHKYEVEHIAANLISKKELVSKEVCDVKHKNIEEKMSGINLKAWGIILLLLANLLTLVSKTWGW
jgi:hypothetical protein